jgi:hypothetical protein
MRQCGAMLVAAFTMITSAGCAARLAQVMPDVDSREAIEFGAAAASAGRALEALSWYEQILATTGVRDEDRRRALRGAAILRMSSDPAMRDLARSRALLAELTAMTPPRRADDYEPEAAIILTLLEDLVTAQAEAEKRGAELGQAVTAAAVLTQSLDATRKQVLDAGLSGEQVKADIERLGTQAQRLQREVEMLRNRTRDIEVELAAARAEIQRKDAALRKVAATLAGQR